MNKTRDLLSKTLVVGVIVLFIGIGVQPVFADYIDKVDDELKDNSDEIGTSDDYKEIITFIYGDGEVKWVEHRGLFRGALSINKLPWGELYLFGIRRSNILLRLFSESIRYVYAPRFIGLTINLAFGHWIIYGFAFGDIEWR